MNFFDAIKMAQSGCKIRRQELDGPGKRFDGIYCIWNHNELQFVFPPDLQCNQGTDVPVNEVNLNATWEVVQEPKLAWHCGPVPTDRPTVRAIPDGRGGVCIDVAKHFTSEPIAWIDLPPLNL